MMRILLLITLFFLATPLWAQENSEAPVDAGSKVIEAPAAKSTTQVYNPPDTTAALLKVTLGLGLVVAAIFVSAWLFRRFAGTAFISNNSMRIITGLSVGSRDRILLVQVGKEQLLVGVSPGRIQTLHVLKEPIEVGQADQNVSAVFADKFSAALKQWKKS